MSLSEVETRTAMGPVTGARAIHRMDSLRRNRWSTRGSVILGEMLRCRFGVMPGV